MTTSERINKIAERREMLDAQQRAMEYGKAMTIANLEKGIKTLAPRIKELIAVGDALTKKRMSIMVIMTIAINMNNSLNNFTLLKTKCISM